MTSLKIRFEDFVQTLEDFESVDQLMLTQHSAKSRADYFLNGRGFILEQKSIEKPPGFNLQDFVQKVVKENNPAPCRIIKPYTRGMLYTNTSYRLAERHFTKGLKASLHRANKQIRETKEIFSLPEAKGIVVLLNDSIADLSPELIAMTVAKSLEKKQKEEFEYSDIGAVIVISETHVINNPTIKNAYPLQTIANSNVENIAEFQKFGSDLVEAWSKFNSWDHSKIDGIESIFPTTRVKPAL